MEEAEKAAEESKFQRPTNNKHQDYNLRPISVTKKEMAKKLTDKTMGNQHRRKAS